MNNEKSSRNRKVVIFVLAGVFALFLILFFVVGLVTSNPTHVAKSYKEAVDEANYEKAYKYLAVEDSVFMTKEEYLTKVSVVSDALNADSTLDFVGKIGEKAVKYISNIYGNFSYRVIDKKTEGDVTEIAFEKKSGVDKLNLFKSEERVHLKKCGRHMLIFPNWKVVDPEVVVTDITIEIPKAEKAYIDGIAMPNSYKVEEKDTTQIFKIPALYTGSHVCSLSNDDVNFDNYRFDTLRSNASIKIQEVNVTTEEQNAAIKAGADAIAAVITAQINNESFNAVDKLFAPKSKEECKSEFEADKKYFYSSNGVIGITSVDISNVKASVVDAALVDGAIEVTIEYDYNLSNKAIINTVVAGSYQGSDADNAVTQTIRLQLHDGEWLVSSFGTNMVTANIFCVSEMKEVS